MKQKILILLLVVALTLSACGQQPATAHTHSFSQEYASDGTHHWRPCDCGEKGGYAEHKWDGGTVLKEPAAGAEGEMQYTCQICKATKTEPIAAEHVHSWDNGVVTVAPTQDSEGVKTFTCTQCGEEKTEPIAKLDPDHTHTFDMTASDEYSHWQACACGAKEQTAQHTWDGGVVTTPATAKEAGITTFTCTACGRKYTQIVPGTQASGLSFLQSTHYRMDDHLAKTPLTLEAEILVSPSQTGRVGAIFGNYIGIRQDWLLEIYENGVPRFYYKDAAGNVRDYKFTNVDVRTGQWVHIAFTFDYAGKTMSLYVDGQLAQAITLEADLAEDITRYKFVIGGDNRSNNGIYFKGQIRSVAAYADVRTAEEIAASAQNGTNLYADDLLAAYLLSENDAGKDIKDLSGNGYGIAREWLDSHEPQMDYAYSFAVIGDTQWLSKYKPEKMEGIYDWILANKDSKKIAHVFGLGDITEDWNTAGKETEWIRAHQYISKLNGVIPYSLVRGNHDESKYFFKYFANETYMSQFDGFMGGDDISNSYKLFTIGQTKYLFMTLDFGAGDEMLEWANEVVLAHPEYRVIVTTHGYQGFDGDHLSYDNTPSSGGTGPANDVDTSVGDNFDRSYNTGEQIWEKFISKHPNIFLVMSGHTPDEDILLLQSEGDHGNIVNQMLIDAQWMDPQKDGVGMVAMLYFSADGSQMAVEWISTDTGKYYKEHNQFTLDLTDSFNAPAHAFGNSYNESYHFKACDCGYIYDEEPHEFDGGVLSADGFMVYSCDCGYQRIASATDDPVALELQALLEKYYNSGAYYKSVSVSGAAAVSTFYQGDQFWTAGNAPEKIGNSLTLKDLVLGKAGELRLDLGWNLYEGVYSSTNKDTVKGVRMFLLQLGLDNNDTHQITKVTVADEGNQLRVKLWAGDSLYADATVGYYATTTLVTHAGQTLDVLYTPAGEDGLCRIEMPAVSGYVAEYDYIILSIQHDVLEKTVYYSTVAKWDGKSVSTSLNGSGTEEDPFLVTSGADLAYIRDVVNAAGAQVPNFSGKYFKLTQSIDLDGHELCIGSYPGWADRKGFFGFFDGNHCTIRGIKASGSLFGTIETGWLKNLSAYGVVSGGSTVGGIVGYVANGGVLENLTSYVTVSGKDTLGGIVGNAENQASTVSGCVNYGNVTGTSYIVAGIAGSGGNMITNCVNYGNISSTNDCVGGIAGSTKNTGAITNCYNYGTVTARGKTGGIVGQANKPVSGCVNYGDVSGVWALGGVLGYVKAGDSASVTDCVNYGKVTGSSTGNGGIVGLTENGNGIITITDCVNYGDLQSGWGAGGIAGDTHGTVTGCVNYGDLAAPGDLGGIVGKAYGAVTECINYGTVTGTKDIIGGIVGRLHVATHYSTVVTTNEQKGTVTGPNSQQIIGKVEGVVEELITLNENVIGINHRGWYKAPENTLSAYRESAKQGFQYVECDVQFTSDGVAVLLHDDTIDRTSNGTGVLSQMTYEQVLQYDFSYDDKDTSVDFSAYRGEKIPTFEAFIALCKELGLHPYIEIKGSITDAQAKQLLQIVENADMLEHVSWLSFSGDALAKIAANCATARIVWVITDVDAAKLAATHVPFAQQNLMTGKNEVVFDLWYTLAKQDVCDLLKSHGIPLEVWTVNDANAMLKLNSYVSGVSSDKYNARQVVAEAKANLGA